MHYLNRRKQKNGEEAVSPVIGVMLMLVVVIIIAAVVSAFAGNTVSGTQKAPSATVEIHVKNGGAESTSYFSMKVLGVSDPIPSKNLKMVTSWTTTERSTGNSITGGNTTFAGKASANTDDGTALVTSFSVPTGFGAGVNGWATETDHAAAAQWGNFTWVAGTTCSNNPSSDYGTTTQYVYGTGTHTGVDPMQAILGYQWFNLKQGDVVTVRVIDVPSGKEIADQQVAVEA